VSLPTSKPSVARATSIPIPIPRHVKRREVQSKLPGSGAQEALLPPGLTIVLSSPMMHTPIDISPDPISVHTSSPSSHPSVGCTPPILSRKALAMVHLERTLALVRTAVVKAEPSSLSTHAMQPAAEPDQATSDDWFRASNNDGWYKYKPDQHINGVQLHWEDPNIPGYANYLKPEMQLGSPMLLGSMGPVTPALGQHLCWHPCKLWNQPQVYSVVWVVVCLITLACPPFHVHQFIIP
jgi:hypothetical protein